MHISEWKDQFGQKLEDFALDKKNSTNQIYLGSYKQWLAKQDLSANTLRSYHSRVKKFLVFIEYAGLNHQPLADQNGINMAAALYLDFLKETKSIARSINASIIALNNFSNFLGLKETQTKKERCHSQPGKLLSWQEQNKFLGCITQQEVIRDKALALTIFYSGLRIGDCAQLNIRNVGSRANFICLDHKVKISLNEATSLALRQWLEERQKLYNNEADAPLWLTRQGDRLSISGITFVIKQIGLQAGVAVSTEMLRRTHNWQS